ncbi:MAG TPA: DUF4340 domain-containing protein [Polyangia bacterium]|nr:DUF4340 domain-containing protein [Polyangia bacterium]
MRALGILGAVAALLAAYLLFFDRDPRERASAAGARLTPGLDRAAVRRVTIARAGEPAFALARAGEDWRLAPGDGVADRGAVEDLLNAIDQGESERTADVTPDSAGLSPPRVTVSLEDGRGSAALRLGKTDATGRGVFLQRGPTEAVLVGPRRILQLADRPLDAWRDRRLLPFSPDLVTHVGWRRSPDDREHDWDRIGEGWRNAAGERLAAERVATVLRRIADLRSTASNADAGAGGGGWIALRGPGGTEVQLTPAQLPAGALDDLGPALAAADAPDRRLLPVSAERVRRVSLADGDRRLVLLRDGAGQPWRFGPPDEQMEVDQTAVADWLARLADTEVTAPAKIGRRIVAGDQPDDGVTVGRADPAYDLLAPDPLRFRSRKVLDFAHFDVREVKRVGGGVTFDLHTTDGETWSSAQHQGAIDRAAADRIVAALGNLRAEGFLASAPRGPPQIALDVAVQPPGAPAPAWHRLALWEGCVGRADDKLAFRIARAPCNELRLDPAPKR